MISESLNPASSRRTDEIHQSLQRLDRKDSWRWWNAILVIMLLTGAIIVLSLPTLIKEDDPSFQLQLTLAVRGLLGLVMIFNLYSLYQQHLLRQLRNSLAAQIESATEQKVRAETFYELAILDPLTGLYNRRFGEERLNAEIARAVRQSDPLVLVLLDLDKFKTINDHFGHSAGDTVLKEFASRLKRSTRGSDIAVRMGGDEFMVILPDCPEGKVQLVLSRLVDFEVEIEGEKVLVSSSRGWSEYQSGDTPEELCSRADKALYAHKAMRVAVASEV
jgi:diguanylate cyclase (GGDEF)-like protein